VGGYRSNRLQVGSYNKARGRVVCATKAEAFERDVEVGGVELHGQAGIFGGRFINP
jgi:hypothetical protein